LSAICVWKTKTGRRVGLHKPGNIQIDNRRATCGFDSANTPIKLRRAAPGEIQSDFEEIKLTIATTIERQR